MKLPDLNDLDFESSLDEFEETPSKKETPQKPKAKPKKEVLKKEVKEKEDKKKSIIPKTTYDAEGRPVLAIPDLDDVDLKSEIDRFFGSRGGR